MPKSKKSSSPFNGALESSLRSLFLLATFKERSFTLQELIYFDYLLVHSGDAGGPPSLHPAVPHRGGEWMVRRHLVEHGLAVCVARELVVKSFSVDGIKYGATDLGNSVIKYFESPYSQQLLLCAEWLKQTYMQLDEQDLQQILLSNVGKWGTEFNREALVRGDIDV